MPSLIGSGIDANYRQQIVPFSRFGSRKIVWFKISHADTQQSSGVLDQVVFNALIDGIQTKAEIVTVGAPKISTNWGRFIVGVFEDTFNNGIMTNGIDDDNDKSGYNSDYELIEVKPRIKETVWINIYDGYKSISHSEKVAEERADCGILARLKVDIDVEEGHGLT